MMMMMILAEKFHSSKHSHGDRVSTVVPSSSVMSLEQLDLLSFCLTRDKKRGRIPTITGFALIGCKEKRFEPGVPPVRKPNENKVSRMFSEALRVVLMFIMGHHMYTFDDKVKL